MTRLISNKRAPRIVRDSVAAQGRQVHAEVSRKAAAELVTFMYADKLEEHLRSISLEGLESTSALLNRIQTQARAVSLPMS